MKAIFVDLNNVGCCIYNANDVKNKEYIMPVIMGQDQSLSHQYVIWTPHIQKSHIRLLNFLLEEFLKDANFKHIIE